MKTKVFFLSCIFLWSCSQTQELPQGVLNKEEMIEVLLDVYMAQAKIAKERSIERDSAEVLYRHYQDYILKQRNSDTITFYNSLTYYFEHPEDFEIINEIVLDSLNLRLEKLEAQEDKIKQERDKKRENKTKDAPAIDAQK